MPHRKETSPSCENFSPISFVSFSLLKSRKQLAKLYKTKGKNEQKKRNRKRNVTNCERTNGLIFSSLLVAQREEIFVPNDRRFHDIRGKQRVSQWMEHPDSYDAYSTVQFKSRNDSISVRGNRKNVTSEN